MQAACAKYIIFCVLLQNIPQNANYLLDDLLCSGPTLGSYAVWREFSPIAPFSKRSQLGAIATKALGWDYGRASGPAKVTPFQ